MSLSRTEILEHTRRLRSFYQQRNVIRWGPEPKPQFGRESVLEHCWGSIMLVDFFGQIMPEKELVNVDLNRVKTLLMYHDLTETETGDKLQVDKTAEDEDAPDDVVVKVVDDLPQPMRNIVLAAIREFQAGETPNAQFALATEKTEPTVDLYLTGIQKLVNVPEGKMPPGRWHIWDPSARFNATELFPTMHKFGEVLGSEIESRLQEYRRSQNLAAE